MALPGADSRGRFATLDWVRTGLPVEKLRFAPSSSSPVREQFCAGSISRSKPSFGSWELCFRAGLRGRGTYEGYRPRRAR
jgi:hypothetical protein